MLIAVTTYRIGEAADLLGVSVDTVRRWIDAGRLGAARDEHGHRSIAGADLAAFARSLSDEPDTASRNVCCISCRHWHCIDMGSCR